MRYTLLVFFLFLPHVIYCEITRDSTLTMFGHVLSSRVGIAACSLTATSAGIKWAASRGYDVLTYKTIRSACIPIKSADIYYVDVRRQLAREDFYGSFSTKDCMQNSDALALTNLFGIGSSSPDETISDLKKARTALSEGQILIVSIYGFGNDQREQISDFVSAARIAYLGGADIIEANLSCPNLGGKNFIYAQPALVYEICKAIKIELPDMPLIIKVGVFETYEQTKNSINAACRGGAQGICGINTIPVQIIDSQGNPIYGPDRLISGLSGKPIHDLALEFVRHVRTIIDEDKLDMILLGCGGITEPHDFAAMLAAGADIALCASGVFHNENLASHYHQIYQH